MRFAHHYIAGQAIPIAVLEAAQYAGYKTATIQSAVRYDVSYAEY
ncbi:phosphoenolpyruvate carboxylase, partial [Pyrobaculum aerophilum]